MLYQAVSEWTEKLQRITCQLNIQVIHILYYFYIILTSNRKSFCLTMWMVSLLTDSEQQQQKNSYTEQPVYPLF